MKVAVRCCCKPVKVLGWFDVPEGTPIRSGGTLPVRELAPLTEADWHAKAEDTYPAPVVHHLRLLEFNEWGLAHVRHHGVAVISDHRPVEFFDRIQGFIRNPEWRA